MSYSVEIIDRAVTCGNNIIIDPLGSGIAVNLNTAHGDPGELMSITGNVIDGTVNLGASFAAIIVDGLAGASPETISITGNTISGFSCGIRVASYVVGYTISANTIRNTGSSRPAIAALGPTGTVNTNTIFRVAAVGSGRGGHVVIGGTGMLCAANNIAGNSQIDNAILVNSATTTGLISNNYVSGALNAVFSSSTSPLLIVRNNTADSGYALQPQNVANDNYNSFNGLNVTQNYQAAISTYTVANLPIAAPLGSKAYATNGRLTGEGAGAGTGVPVYRATSGWRSEQTHTAIAA